MPVTKLFGAELQTTGSPPADYTVTCSSAVDRVVGLSTSVLLNTLLCPLPIVSLKYILRYL